MAQDCLRTMPVFGSLMSRDLMLAHMSKIAIRLQAFYMGRRLQDRLR